MTWARQSQAGDAIVILSTDEVIDDANLKKIEAIDDIAWARCVKL